MRSKLRRRTGVVAAIAGVVLGGVALLAPPAAAQSANPCPDHEDTGEWGWQKIDHSSSSDVLPDGSTLSWTKDLLSYDVLAGGQLDICIKSGNGVTFTPAPDYGLQAFKGYYHDLTGSGTIDPSKDISHVSYRYSFTPPHDECPNLPGDQPEGTNCNPPPHDECPNLPGDQPDGTNCNPPPHDECPNLPGDQPDGTDCDPEPCEPPFVAAIVDRDVDEQEEDCEPEDACPDVAGVQESASECPPPPPPPPPPPGVEVSPIADASVVDCAGPDGSPGLRITLLNTGSADAVFTVVVDGASVGDPETLTVTQAEGAEVLEFTQAEDEAFLVEIASSDFVLDVTVDGDCAAVLGDTVTTPTTPTAGPPAPPTAVAGVQQTRVLARTGASHAGLLLTAALLLVLGGGCLFGSTSSVLDRRR